MAMSNGGAFTDNFGNMGPILLPLVIAGVGIVASIIGTFFVGIKNNEAKEKQAVADAVLSGRGDHARHQPGADLCMEERDQDDLLRALAAGSPGGYRGAGLCVVRFVSRFMKC